MTNLEWLLKNEKATLLKAIAGAECWYVDMNGQFHISCRNISCVDCKFYDSHSHCSVEKLDWLNAEHEESLLFPVGTVVEVPAPYDSDTTELRYYWGVYHGLHYACKLKSSLGETLTNGHPICDFYDPATIRKVGD